MYYILHDSTREGKGACDKQSNDLKFRALQLIGVLMIKKHFSSFIACAELVVHTKKKRGICMHSTIPSDKIRDHHLAQPNHLETKRLNFPSYQYLRIGKLTFLPEAADGDVGVAIVLSKDVCSLIIQADCIIIFFLRCGFAVSLCL